MSKKEISAEESYKLINFGPCCLITAGNMHIKNIAPVAWLTPLNDEPALMAVCVASSHYTAHLIRKYKQFVVNVPSAKQRNLVIKAGSISGKRKDKIEWLKIPIENGKVISTIHMKECVGFLELKLVSEKTFSGVSLFIGKVVFCEVEKSMYSTHILPDRAKTIHHIGSNKFFVSSKIIR
ncbi:MAG: flavin reductase family protein [bacterium]